MNLSERGTPPRSVRQHRRLLASTLVLALVVVFLAVSCADGSSDGASFVRGSAFGRVVGGKLPSRLRSSRGPVRYVAPSGSNRNRGTKARPWRTIQHALDVLRPGQKALVRAGTYTESLVMDRAGSEKEPITVRAYPGEHPVVHPGGSGSMDYPLRVTAGAAYFRFSGFIIEGAPLDSTMNIWISDGQQQSGPPPTHDIEISNCEIRSGMGSGVLVSPHTDSVQLIGNSVHDNGDGSRQHQGLYFQGQHGLIANNVVYHQTNGFGIQVRGNYPDSDTGLRIPARNVVVTNNTVADNSLSGIMVENNATQVLVVNNISASNDAHGVVGYDDDSADVLSGNRATGNLAWKNGDGGFGNTGRPVMAFLGGNVVANPRFVDAGRRNFQLRSGSPAVNRALRAFAMPFDRDGRRRSRPDLGALER